MFWSNKKKYEEEIERLKKEVEPLKTEIETAKTLITNLGISCLDGNNNPIPISDMVRGYINFQSKIDAMKNYDADNSWKNNISGKIGRLKDEERVKTEAIARNIIETFKTAIQEYFNDKPQSNRNISIDNNKGNEVIHIDCSDWQFTKDVEYLLFNSCRMSYYRDFIKDSLMCYDFKSVHINYRGTTTNLSVFY